MTDRGPVETERGRSSLRKQRRPGESLIRGFLFVCGAVSIAITVGIVYELGTESILFFQDERVTIFEFLTTTMWQPQVGGFGIWPLILGTMYISIIAMVVAIPIGLASAIYLSEYASRRVRSFFKPVLEVLVGIPTVVFGFFALTFITPSVLRPLFGDRVVGFNMLAAGIGVGILTIPLVASVTEDALRAVPRSLREASYGLGATRMATSIRVVVPAAVSGVAASMIIAFSRAVGETMVVAIAAGATGGSLFGWDVFQPGQTMTAAMAALAIGSD